MNASGPYWWSVNMVNMASGNGLVLSGNKPLPEQMLTQISVTMTPLGHNELIQVKNWYITKAHIQLALYQKDCDA